MARTKSANYFRFGPSIPIVPINHFSRMVVTDEQFAGVWKICGPSAEYNMRGSSKRPPLQLWQVIASAYLEGLHHGAELVREQYEKEDAGN